MAKKATNINKKESTASGRLPNIEFRPNSRIESIRVKLLTLQPAASARISANVAFASIANWLVTNGSQCTQLHIPARLDYGFPPRYSRHHPRRLAQQACHIFDRPFIEAAFSVARQTVHTPLFCRALAERGYVPGCNRHR